MAHRGSRQWFEEQYRYLEGGAASSGYAFRLRASQGVRLDRIASLLASRLPRELGEGRLLDLGCGSGDLLARLPPPGRGMRLGIDLAARPLRHARRRFPHLAWIQAALPRLPLADDSLDLVCLLELLYYLDPAQQQAAMAEAARLLRPGGWLCVSSRLDREEGGRFLTEERLRRLVEERFRVEAAAHHHLALIRPWERGLMGLLRTLEYQGGVAARLASGAVGEAECVTRAWRWYRALARFPATARLVALHRLLLAGAARGVTALLGWSLPARLAEGVGRRLLPGPSRSGVVLLCRLRGAEEAGGSGDPPPEMAPPRDGAGRRGAA